MKKAMALVLSLALCCAGSLGMAGTARADGQPISPENGGLTDVRMMTAIEEYLNSKTMAADELAAALNLGADSVNSVSSVFMEDAEARREQFSALESRLNVDFDQVKITASVDEIVSQTESTVVVRVYEETMIDYYAAPGISAADVMGYGTDHVMTLELIGEEYHVTADSYDERLITGACSADLAGTPIMSDMPGELFAEMEEASESDVPSVAAISGYSVNAAIDYADRWCGVAGAKDYASSDGIVEEKDDSSRYNNSEYTPQINGAGEIVDCANFVSQCLKAGGMETDKEWDRDCFAWYNAKGLHRYLKKKVTVVKANNSNVFPGNPVYWWNGNEEDDKASPSGHQMICVGYNSAGVPVVDGHSDNIFRVPITNYMNNGEAGLYTAQITGSNQHSHVGTNYEYDKASHRGICRNCRITMSWEPHSVAYDAGGVYCKVCGARGPFFVAGR